MQKYQDLLLNIPESYADTIYEFIDKYLQSSKYKRRIDIEADHLKTFEKSILF
ncbi:MAG: hypothetical protein IPO49_09835 [Bacteroidetes bacterium]|nr:hypothetical protein [Bacteroidota bacterium]